MALRALVLILAVASFFAAGGERWKRVTAAFDWSGVVAPANFRIDAWVTPPVYTGRPPVMLPGLRPGETAQTATAGLGAGRQPACDPLDRQCALRYRAQRRHRGRAGRGARGSAGRHRRAPLRHQGRRLRRSLHGVGSSDLAWNFTAIPDRAPTIELIKDPERQARGALRLDYRMEDDYGVVEAQAAFALKDEDARPTSRAHPLFTARRNSRSRCRRRAPAAARRRPRATSPSIPGPAPKSR